MNILGIETSCDETAAAVVKDGRYILSNTVASSLAEHAQYGGIIPEIASRKQIESISLIVSEALRAARCSMADINAIAVTGMPGLIGSLLVGISFARAASFALRTPLVEIDHVRAHLYANFLSDTSAHHPPPKLPAIGLVVSGGHSSIFYIKNAAECQRIGKTRDDALGETYDKVARMLGLGYPGGPVIDRLAQSEGDRGKNSISFTCAELRGTLDFSFSGIKTAVLYHIQKYRNTDVPVAAIAHAFQTSVVSIVVEKSLAACARKKVRTLLVGGGVAANTALRRQLADHAADNGISVYFPPIPLCMDNAAMVASAGYYRCARMKSRALKKVPR